MNSRVATTISNTAMAIARIAAAPTATGSEARVGERRRVATGSQRRDVATNHAHEQDRADADEDRQSEVERRDVRTQEHRVVADRARETQTLANQQTADEGEGKQRRSGPDRARLPGTRTSGARSQARRSGRPTDRTQAPTDPRVVNGSRPEVPHEGRDLLIGQRPDDADAQGVEHPESKERGRIVDDRRRAGWWSGATQFVVATPGREASRYDFRKGPHSRTSAAPGRQRRPGRAGSPAPAWMPEHRRRARAHAGCRRARDTRAVPVPATASRNCPQSPDRKATHPAG